MRVLAVEHQRDAGLGVFAEALREDGHELEIWRPPLGARPPSIFDAVIVLGGAVNVEQRAEQPWLERELEAIAGWVDAGLPLLGVCLGSQLVAEAAGGAVRRAPEPEIGWFDVAITQAGEEDPILGPLAPRFEAFQWHSYECVLPAGAVELATGPVCPQAFRLGESAWAVQFHPEVSRADALHWIDDYRSDPDAIRIGVDPVAMREEAEPKLEAWNALGRGLVRRWADVAGT